MSGNPHIKVSWDASVEGGFIRYNVKRKGPGETAFIRIATITAIATTEYEDYAAGLVGGWVYVVTQTALISGSEVEGIDSNSAMATLEACVQHWGKYVRHNRAFLHDVTDPDDLWAELVWEPTQAFQRNREQVLVQYWGSPQPVAEIGQAQWRSFTVGAYIANREDTEARLQQLLAGRQKLLYRDGRGTRIFCNFSDAYSFSYRWPVGEEVSVPLVECAYTEAV